MRLGLLFVFLMMVALGRPQASQIGTTPGNLPQSVDRKNVRIDQHLGIQIPLDATFRDRTGKSVQFGEVLQGKPAIVLPIFYNCTGVCNLELRGALETLRTMKGRQLGRDFDVIVVGIHPKETPDLAEGKYKASVADLDRPGTEGGWKFLVGDADNIHRVTDALGFYYTYDEAKDAIDHPSGLMFLTAKGKVSSYIYGAKYTATAFEKNLDLATRGEVGEKATEIFFGCIHIDPVTGKRSVVIKNVLKVLGFLTLGIMGFSLMVLTGRTQIRKRRG
ncbi:MAG: SCO family protein [Fimbriimonas sp.]